MSDEAFTRVVGCLLDVSGSMRKALEAGRSDEHAVERLVAVLRAALKVAQAEHRHDPGALVFVGLFGLDTDTKPGCPSGVDLFSVTETLVDDDSNHRSGHERLIALANDENRPNITKYIREKLTDVDARIVHAYLQRHEELKSDFLDNIPPPEEWERKRKEGQTTARKLGFAGGCAFGFMVGPLGMALGASIGAALGGPVGDIVVDKVEDGCVHNSEALRLAHRICDEWLADFVELTPRPVADVIKQLQRLQERIDNESENTLLRTLRRYLYGRTPMRDILARSSAVFREYSTAKQGVLLLVSDGFSTDGDPLPQVRELRQHSPEVTIATVYLSSDGDAAKRRIYDQPDTHWNNGQRMLFSMASKVSINTHPIPVLATIGWEIPSSGSGALYATVCSAAALEEFCSMLVSARFGVADTLLDIVGRLPLDKYINDEHVRTCRRPSDQGGRKTCYAHAAAAVIHMALVRIVGRVGGYPSIEEIRRRILDSFPPGPDGRRAKDVLEKATPWYPPLRFREVDEDGARQAVLRRRPVLATFYLSEQGWEAFSKHFTTNGTNKVPLTRAKMAMYRSLPHGGGHAVVLTGCEPLSLTLLNSWGKNWGDRGRFSIEDHTVLELDDATGATRMRFYDVYWLEDDLKDAEKKAFDDEVDRKLRDKAEKYPSLLELDARCPHCCQDSPIAKFRGSIRESVCPRCGMTFKPESCHLLRALYARAGFGDAE
ncbi:hypothetical protein N0V84_006749 [Fusarium piperis]|uniref:VWFA domain-containing protein n=1 Tax=Fusarium piperis TaxID=1435070 RepID=A0A9W8WB99_9HYPO|nr:hypothetical protein N0V84_006749 [Fusarium piperis]